MTVDYGNPEAVAVWMSARPTRNPILETMRDGFDGGDAWGSVMAWRFAIADVVTEIDAGQVPAEWEFSQSLFGADAEAYEYQAILEAMRDGGAVLEDLIHAGNVLMRYARQLELAGEDY